MELTDGRYHHVRYLGPDAAAHRSISRLGTMIINDCCSLALSL